MQQVFTRKLSREKVYIDSAPSKLGICGRVCQFNILFIQYNQITGKINMGKDKFLKPVLTDKV